MSSEIAMFSSSGSPVRIYHVSKQNKTKERKREDTQKKSISFESEIITSFTSLTLNKHQLPLLPCDDEGMKLLISFLFFNCLLSMVYKRNKGFYAKCLKEK